MKNTKPAKKLFSLALVLAMALCCLPAASATENEITVDFSFFNQSPIIPKSQITIYDGISEEYGYEMSSTDHNGVKIEAVTVFDAIVSAHISYFGDNFTPETADGYLSMSDGFITKIFGISTSALGFCINDKMATDGIYIDAYGGYTGYACDTATLEEGDYVSVFIYQDSMWSDYYITLSNSALTVAEGEEFSLSASGLSIMWYGFSTQETIDSVTSQMSGLNVKVTTDFEAYETVAALDEKGEVTLSFENEGTYYICVDGKYSDPASGEIPVIANWCKITVIREETEAPEEIEDAFYLPKGIRIFADYGKENEKIVLSFSIELFDINSVAPDTEKNFVIQINCFIINAFVDFIMNVL